MFAMKAPNQLEDQNNHLLEVEQKLQKMISKVEEENCEDNEVVLKDIDSQKRIIDYFQSLVEAGKFKYEKMNKLSEGMGSKMFRSEQNVVASK